MEKSALNFTTSGGQFFIGHPVNCFFTNKYEVLLIATLSHHYMKIQKRKKNT